MEHPLIGNLDSLSEQELLEKITELNRKLSIAYQTGNNYLCNQLRMAIESYNGKYQQKMRALSAPKSGETDSFNDKIDIS